jgi:hypothetical protein
MASSRPITLFSSVSGQASRILRLTASTATVWEPTRIARSSGPLEGIAMQLEEIRRLLFVRSSQNLALPTAGAVFLSAGIAATAAQHDLQCTTMIGALHLMSTESVSLSRFCVCAGGSVMDRR